MSKQTDVREGPIRRLAGLNLAGREGFCAVLDGTGKVILCAADQRPVYVIDEGGASQTMVTIIPIDSTRQFRVCTNGALTAGAQFQTAANGEIIVLGAGTARGVVEEAASASDLALVRFY
jgi:hypothetical protein